MLLRPGAIEGIVELVRAGQKEKVVRVGLLALKQLLQDPSLGYGATLVDASLLKLVTTRSMQARDLHPNASFGPRHQHRRIEPFYLPCLERKQVQLTAQPYRNAATQQRRSPRGSVVVYEVAVPRVLLTEMWNIDGSSSLRSYRNDSSSVANRIGRTRTYRSC